MTKFKFLSLARNKIKYFMATNNQEILWFHMKTSHQVVYLFRFSGTRMHKNSKNLWNYSLYQINEIRMITTHIQTRNELYTLRNISDVIVWNTGNV